jgi:hypothetical protein
VSTTLKTDVSGECCVGVFVFNKRKKGSFSACRSRKESFEVRGSESVSRGYYFGVLCEGKK